jgi:MFS family permease
MPAEQLPKVASGERRAAIFAGLVLVLLLAALDSTIVATALPTIVGELGGLTHLSWVVTAYLLAQTVVTPLYGKLGDLYGDPRCPGRLRALRTEQKPYPPHHFSCGPRPRRRWSHCEYPSGHRRRGPS